MLKKCALHKCILRKSPAVQVHGLPSKGKNTRVRLNNNHHRETNIKDTRQSSFFFFPAQFTAEDNRDTVFDCQKVHQYSMQKMSAPTCRH